jgi:hypothetical protein
VAAVAADDDRQRRAARLVDLREVAPQVPVGGLAQILGAVRPRRDEIGHA